MHGTVMYDAGEIIDPIINWQDKRRDIPGEIRQPDHGRCDRELRLAPSAYDVRPADPAQRCSISENEPALSSGFTAVLPGDFIRGKLGRLRLRHRSNQRVWDRPFQYTVQSLAREHHREAGAAAEHPTVRPR
jgi:hypothetical protein